MKLLKNTNKVYLHNNVRYAKDVYNRAKYGLWWEWNPYCIYDEKINNKLNKLLTRLEKLKKLNDINY